MAAAFLSLFNLPTVKIRNFKNARWQRSPSLKVEKSAYLSNGLTDQREILHGDAHWHVDAYLPIGS